MTEDEMVGWHHQLNGHEFEQTPGNGEGQGRAPGGGHGNPLQYSCQENPMDRGAWWATVRGVAVMDD